MPVTDASVRASVDAYVQARGAYGNFAACGVASPTGTPDGQTAEVTLVAVVTTPLVTSVISDYAGGIPLRVTARRAPVSDEAGLGERRSGWATFIGRRAGWARFWTGAVLGSGRVWTGAGSGWERRSGSAPGRPDRLRRGARVV